MHRLTCQSTSCVAPAASHPLCRRRTALRCRPAGYSHSPWPPSPARESNVPLGARGDEPGRRVRRKGVKECGGKRWLEIWMRIRGVPGSGLGATAVHLCANRSSRLKSGGPPPPKIESRRATQSGFSDEIDGRNPWRRQRERYAYMYTSGSAQGTLAQPRPEARAAALHAGSACRLSLHRRTGRVPRLGPRSRPLGPHRPKSARRPAVAGPRPPPR